MPSCRLENCSATRSNPNITLHQFPKDPVVRNLWLEFCRCRDGTNLYVCSQHFRQADYENIFMSGARRKLRRDAVPTIREPNETDRASRAMVRNRKKLVDDLLAEAEEKSRKAVNYELLVAEVFAPLKSSDLLSSDGPMGKMITEEMDVITTPTWEKMIRTEEPTAEGMEETATIWGKLDQMKEPIGTKTDETVMTGVKLDWRNEPMIEGVKETAGTLGKLDRMMDSTVEGIEETDATWGKLSRINGPMVEGIEETAATCRKLELTKEPMPGDMEETKTTLRTLERMEETVEPEGKTMLDLMDDTVTSNFGAFIPFLNSTVIESSSPGFIRVKRGTIKKLKSENVSLRGVIRSLRTELKEKDKIIRALSGQNQRKAQEIEQLRKQNEQSLSVLEHRIRAEVDGAFGKIFTKNQTDLILGRKKKVKWTDDEIMLAFALRYHSQPAYEMVRRELKIPLPSLRRLREFASGMDMRGGVLEDVLSVLGATAKSMSPRERVVVLSYDEMATKETSELDKRTDKHLGPHKEMQVIAVRGMFSKWKTPVFVDFDRPMNMEILNDVIGRLHTRGFTVAAIVHDCGGGNLALWKQAGINHSNQKVSIPHPVTKEEIFFFPDAPHLLKLIRNWLLDHGFYYNGKLITKRFLVELVKKASTLKNPFSKSHPESKNIELNALFKLTMKHVTCEGSERQNVRLAAQLLSHTTAVNLRRHFGQYEEAVLLADIIDIINSWFDTMNSSRIHESIPDKQCYGMAEDVQNRNLQRMEELMSNMRTLHKQSLPAATHLQIFQKAVLTSIQSVKRLLVKMRLDYGISFIMTFKLDQDFLENLFAMTRLNGGSNDHPSPLEALNRIRLIILGKSLSFPLSANQNTALNQDVEEHFLMSQIFRKKKETTSNNPDEPIDEEDDDIEPWAYEPKRRNLEELDGQHYVYGYMAKSLMKNNDGYGQYTHQLESSTDDMGKENYVEDLSRGGLVQPSQEWTETADQMEDYFNYIHNRGPYNEEPGFRNPENIYKRSMQKLSKQFPSVPQDVIKTFVKKRVNIRIRHLKKQIQEKKLHRYKIMKNNKRQKTTQKSHLTKNQKKLQHFII